MIPEQFIDTSYILVRHGLSEFNFRNIETKSIYGHGSDEWRAVQKDETLVDPELHQAGIMQCEA